MRHLAIVLFLAAACGDPKGAAGAAGIPAEKMDPSKMDRRIDPKVAPRLDDKAVPRLGDGSVRTIEDKAAPKAGDGSVVPAPGQ